MDALLADEPLPILEGITLIGLAIPFIAVLIALRRFRRLAGRLGERRRIIDVVTGTLVAGVGILVFTGSFARLAGLFNFGIV